MGQFKYLVRQLKFKKSDMSGYPTQGGYPQGGYPGAPRAQGGYPGAPPPAQGGYPGAPPPPQGGYPGAPPPNQGGYPGAQPAVAPQIQQWFNAVDQDRSGQITAQELQKALVNGNWSNFSEEACRLMIDIYDNDRTGTIDIREFQQLFQSINQWKGTFEGFDRDRSGKIEQNELEQGESSS